MKSDYTHIDSEQRSKLGFFATLKTMFFRTLGARELIWQLYKRDFINANKRSLIGFGWHVITPLVNAITWIFMYSTGLIVPGDMAVPYPVFVLMGMSLWSLFSTFFNMATRTIASARGYVAQVSYPHEAMLVKVCMQGGSLFLIGFVFNLIIISLLGYPPTWWVLLMPLLAMPLFFFGAGIGLVFSVLTVSDDIDKAIATFFNFLLYSVPVIYTLKPEGLLSRINRANPLTYLLVFPRDLILSGDMTYLVPFLWVSGGSALLFMVCARVFYVSEMLVIERMT